MEGGIECVGYIKKQQGPSYRSNCEPVSDSSFLCTPQTTTIIKTLCYHVIFLGHYASPLASPDIQENEHLSPQKLRDLIKRCQVSTFSSPFSMQHEYAASAASLATVFSAVLFTSRVIVSRTIVAMSTSVEPWEKQFPFPYLSSQLFSLFSLSLGLASQC